MLFAEQRIIEMEFNATTMTNNIGRVCVFVRAVLLHINNFPNYTNKQLKCEANSNRKKRHNSLHISRIQAY